MAKPRFDFNLPRINPYMVAGGAPRLFQSSTFKVYDKYWIDNCKEQLNFAPEHTACGQNPFFPWHYEGAVYEFEHEYWGSLPSGKYISHSDTVQSEYNPLKDKQPLILKFAKVGKTGKINEKAILEFVSKYGLLKEQETLYPSVNILYPKYSVSAFYYYAREAYLITSLYRALINKKIDKNKIVILLDNLFKTEDLSLTFFQLGNWKKLLAKEFNILPQDIQKTIKGEYLHYIEVNHRYIEAERNFLDGNNAKWAKRNEECYDLEIEGEEPFAIDQELVKELQNLEDEQHSEQVADNKEPDEKNHFIANIEGLSDDLWTSVLNNASNEFVLDLCANVIVTITNLRISADSVLYVKPISPSIGRENYQFVGSSGSLTLLSCMWLLFYLMITNQLEVYYRECLHCGLPIENPRSNQKYCSNEKCRQGYNTKLKRAVQKLWKEGNSKEEILEKVDVGTEQVENWTTSSR